MNSHILSFQIREALKTLRFDVSESLASKSGSIEGLQHNGLGTKRRTSVLLSQRASGALGSSPFTLAAVGSRAGLRSSVQFTAPGRELLAQSSRRF